MADKLKIELFSDHILAEPAPEEPLRSPGGITLTGHSPDYFKSKVVAVGPGVVVDGKTQVLPVKVGDTVLTVFKGNDFTVEGKKYWLLKSHELVGRTWA